MKNKVGWISAFLLTYWKVIVGVAVLGLAVWGAYLGATAWIHKQRDRGAGEQARRSALVARADAQHQQYLAGEGSGIHGEYPPAALD